ncbi:hypothetical protein ACQJBY_067492 [Aegilops geniculata]
MEEEQALGSLPGEHTLVAVLRRYADTGELPAWVHEMNAYDASPVLLTAGRRNITAADGSTAWYLLYTPARKAGSSSRCSRTAGGGTWIEERTRPVEKAGSGGGWVVIGQATTFTYGKRTTGPDKKRTTERLGWILVEVRLPGERLCCAKLYPSPRRPSASAPAPSAAAGHAAPPAAAPSAAALLAAPPAAAPSAAAGHAAPPAAAPSAAALLAAPPAAAPSAAAGHAAPPAAAPSAAALLAAPPAAAPSAAALLAAPPAAAPSAAAVPPPSAPAAPSAALVPAPPSAPAAPSAALVPAPPPAPAAPSAALVPPPSAPALAAPAPPAPAPAAVAPASAAPGEEGTEWIRIRVSTSPAKSPCYSKQVFEIEEDANPPKRRLLNCRAWLSINHLDCIA